MDRYAPRIYGWCRRHSLQESDASDATQEVLSKLVKAMQTFKYSPVRGTFRAWLKTVTKNAIRDLTKDLTRPGRGSGDSQAQRNLSAIQDPEALQALAETIEEEGEYELLREAEAHVKLRVKSHIWDAYRLTVRESSTSAEAGMLVRVSGNSENKIFGLRRAVGDSRLMSRR